MGTGFDAPALPLTEERKGRSRFMSKTRTPDDMVDRSLARRHIGEQLKNYYRAFTTEELPPRLLKLVKKLDEETEVSAEPVPVIRDIEN
jgi:hypothetical protein